LPAQEFWKVIPYEHPYSALAAGIKQIEKLTDKAHMGNNLAGKPF